MRLGAFEINEPIPELGEPHALVMIRPWVDVGSVGTVTLGRLERHFEAKELGKLARPGTFFDFTRYRPDVRNVNGERVTTIPNSNIRYAKPEGGPDLIFIRLLDPHAMAEDYVESVVEVLKHFQVKVYCRIGAMYDSVPHTRPIVVTGTGGTLQPREGMTPALVQQRGSQYEGPTTILNTLTDAINAMGLPTMNFMAHLPHYAQLEEDYAGASQMLKVLSAYYDIPSTVAPTRRAARQYREVEAAVERKPELKSLISRLEAHYDSTYDVPSQQEKEKPQDTGPLSPDIEQFLKGLDLDL